MIYFYYHNGNEQLGPFLIDELKKEPLTSTILVWKEGTPDWLTADKIEELEHLFLKPKFEKEIPKPPPIKEAVREEKKLGQKIEPKNSNEQKSSVGWKILKYFFFIIVILGIIGVVMIAIEKDFDASSVINSPSTIDLSVRCSEVNDLLISSEVNITVENNSSRTHDDVTVKIIGYDKNGNEVKEKITTFDRTLQPNGSLTKPIILPARVERCDCIITNSSPR